MKREAFEEMVQDALSAMATSMVESPVKKSGSKKKGGIGGLRYGEAERKVAKAVSLLASSQRVSKPLMAPSPEMVPPCF